MWQQRKKLIEQIEERRKSRLICYVTSNRPGLEAQLAKDALRLFYSQLREPGEPGPGRLDVLLFTLGGDTVAGFGLGRLVREFAREVRVLVPGDCRSAGTLFALSANQIFMTRFGTLSPIDPSVTTPFNPLPSGVAYAPGQFPPGQSSPLPPVSVESVSGFYDLVTKSWQIGGADKAAAFKLLADKVHPLALGDVYRRRQQIELLARTLLQARGTGEGDIEKIVKKLTTELGSHDYPIYRSEARELLGSQVAGDDPELEDLLSRLLDDFSDEMLFGRPYHAALAFQQEKSKGLPAPIRMRLQLAAVESRKARHVYERTVILSESEMQLPGQPVLKVVQQQLVDEGWGHYT